MLEQREAGKGVVRIGVGLWRRIDGGRARRSWRNVAAVCAGEEARAGYL